MKPTRPWVSLQPHLAAAVAAGLTLAMATLAAPPANAAPAGDGQAFQITDGPRPVATVFIADPLFTEEQLANPPRRFDPVWRDQRAWTWAVNDLVDHVRRITGVTLPVVVTDDPARIVEPAIVLGRLAREAGLEVTKQVDSGDGLRILVTPKRLLAAGQAGPGDRHAIYTILRQFGCDWVMPGDIGIITPTRANLALPAQDLSDAPAFLGRNLGVGGYRPRLPEEDQRFDQWKQRMMGGMWQHPVAQTAGHHWDYLIRTHRAEFDANPEMLALVRDHATGQLVRSGPQIESTHPRIRDLIVEHIRKTYQSRIAAGEWTRLTPAGFPIGPADGFGYSISPESLIAASGRLDPVTGDDDTTDLLILLGNQILEVIHEEYPNAIVGFYNYSTHADYPARYHPHPNIGQIFAPINFSRFHSPADPNAFDWSYYRQVVEQWADLSRKQGNPLMYRGYSWNLADNLLPFSKVRIWGEELPWYRDLGFLALNVQAIKAWSILAPSDYAFMRLAWNPDLPWRELLAEYCRKAYGPAGEILNQYWLNQIDRQHSAGHQAGSYHSVPLIFDRPFVASQHRLLSDARAQPNLQPAELARIDFVQHGLDMMDKYHDYNEAVLAFDFPAARQRFEDLHAHWKAGYDINTDLVDNVAPRYLDRFIRSFVEGAERYASPPWRIVHRIPDALPTLLDPTSSGEHRNLPSPHARDADFLLTRTISTTWDAQGLGSYIKGAVWYRIHCTLPADLTPEDPIGLFLGGFSDEALVWVNGEPIGSSGRGFSRPAAFDITSAIKHGENNVIVIKIHRHNINELGVGGLIRPSFLFTGPRLETQAPKPIPFERVLPGAGEVK